MVESWNVKRVGQIDCPGGGQVWVEGNTLFVGHMRAPGGTSLYDVSDPANPRLLSRIEMPEGWHSHKVRARDVIAAGLQSRCIVAPTGGGVHLQRQARQLLMQRLMRTRSGTGEVVVHRDQHHAHERAAFSD